MPTNEIGRGWRRDARRGGGREAQALHRRGLPDDLARARRPILEGFEADVDRLWEERPADLACRQSRVSGSRSAISTRAPKCRLPDRRPHSHSPTARELYVNRQIFRMVELIFDQKAIAFQSLYFQFGSEQSLHRDPMFVVTKPPSHLLASWTALEDITPECGPLLYRPGHTECRGTSSTTTP